MSSQLQDRRRGKRIPLSFLVEVSGTGTDGIAFCDPGTAADVSDRGCQLVLGRQVKVGDHLSVRVVRKIAGESKQQPFLYEVVWVEAVRDTWIAGLSALEDGNPWGVNFPSTLVVTK